MIYWFLHRFADSWSLITAFDSITLRALLALTTSLVFSMAFGERVIARLRSLKFGQAVRGDGPQTHLVKTGTPTMGGILILISILFSTLLWTNLSNPYIWILMGVMLIFGAVGWADDWLKIKHKSPDGLSARKKYFWLSLGSVGAAIALYLIARAQPDPATQTAMIDLLVPVFKDLYIPLSAIPYGIGFILLTYLVINGSSNAVNLTDGLDGLAILPVVFVATGLGIFCYLTGDVRFADYLNLDHVPYTSELVIVCAAMVGAGLGFLWFNAHPAEVFMGDVGALSLGAMLGTIAVMTRQELAFAIMGGLFVAEAVSVMLQVGSYKLRGKRVFKMAPLHHHFEEHGWKETQVVTRFWIISIMLVVIGLMTIKLR